MKKLLLSLLFVLPFLIVPVVFAHHTTATQNATCQGYEVSADYIGGSSVRKVVTDVNFTLDSVLEHITGDWRGISSGFNLFSRIGSGPHTIQATGTVKMYECSGHLWDSNQKCDGGGSNNHNDDNGWHLLSTDTFNLDFKADCAPSPTPSPSLTPSPSPSSTPEPSATPTPSETPVPSPTPTPTCEEFENCEPVPSPSQSPSTSPAPSEEPLPPQHDELPKPPAYECSVTKQVANPLVWRRGDQAIVQWQATEGNTVNIYYKTVESTVWQFSVIGVPNNGYYIIQDLGKLNVSFAIQQDCGPMSKTIVDGPTVSWVLFL